ncbi:UNVERIFIED_CONTAM: hypothetical protein FKN15_030324 [Acipenser sinensis]
MDATAKPLRIPPEMRIYAEQHGIFDLIQVKQLCKHLGATRISTESLLREESDLVKEALEYKTNEQEIPSMLWINLVQQRLSKKDCIKRRGTKRTMSAKGLESTYSTISRVINADQPSIDVFSQVLTFVLSRHRSVAPHTPRILLHGPPGSGKSLQAALIAQKYNIVNICCGQVLKAVAADETSQGELIKPCLETGQQVPDSTVLKILTERLSRLDCTTRGWVLHGCPRNLEQAEKLNSAGFTPNRVFFLDMPDEVAVERVTFRMTDSVTGQRYHSLYKAAPSQQIQDRLQMNPRDSAESLQRRLDLYRTNLPELQELYSDAVYVNADQDPHAIFELLESHIVNRLPKPLSHRVFFLDMPDEVAVERVTFRMTDPITGQRYHSLYKAAPSQQIQDRLQMNPRDSAKSAAASGPVPNQPPGAAGAVQRRRLRQR